MPKNKTVIFGDQEIIKDILSVESKAEGWKKHVSAMEVEGLGCLVHTEIIRESHTSNLSSVFIPMAIIAEEHDESGNIVGRRILHPSHPSLITDEVENESLEESTEQAPPSPQPQSMMESNHSHHRNPPLDPRFKK